MPGEESHLQAYLTYGVSLLITPSLNAFAMGVLQQNTSSFKNKTNCWNEVGLAWWCVVPSSFPCRSKEPPCRPRRHPPGRFCILPRQYRSLACHLGQAHRTQSMRWRARQRPPQWRTEDWTPSATGLPSPRNGLPRIPGSSRQPPKHKNGGGGGEEEGQRRQAGWRRRLATRGLDIWSAERMAQRSKRWSRRLWSLLASETSYALTCLIVSACREQGTAWIRRQTKCCLLAK